MSTGDILGFAALVFFLIGFGVITFNYVKDKIKEGDLMEFSKDEVEDIFWMIWSSDHSSSKNS